MNYQLDRVSFYDRSSWGILRFTGSDRLRYLHNQSTNDFNNLQPGEGCQTVFVTSTARTIDLATAYVTEDAVLVIVSPNRRQQLIKWLDGFIFPFDKVELTDVSAEFSLLTIVGDSSDKAIESLFAVNLQQQPEGTHQLATIDDLTVRIAVGSDLGLPGYNSIVPQPHLATIRSLLQEKEIEEIDSDRWERMRILQGRPIPDRELTEDYNPLEAGLWQTISFDKGCYIGQETIARLNTYNGVKQQLWGVTLDKPVAPETPVILEDKKVGILTSYTETDREYFGLAYVKTKAGGAGLKVKIGDATGELVSLAFVGKPKDS